MENQQVEPTKSKRPYKRRKLIEKPKPFELNHRVDPIKRGEQKHEERRYRKRTGTAGLVQDTWKRLKDRWVNEERQRTEKITRYFSISVQEHEKEELARFLAQEDGTERSEDTDEEALAPDEQSPIPLIAKL